MDAEKLRQRRMALNMTQAELGRRLGVTGQTIYKWETERNKIERPEMLDLAMQTLERATVEQIQRSRAGAMSGQVRKVPMGSGSGSVKCPECEEMAQESHVYERGCSSTELAVNTFYDAEGKQHVHDLNWRTCGFECSNGHTFTTRTRTPCWCGWPEIRES